MTGALIVFAKDPRPGEVKTRLSPPLTPEQASGLYACMLDDVLAWTARYGPAHGLEPIVAVHPPEACPEMARRIPTGVRVTAQRGDDLGARMESAIADAAERGLGPILMRGSDSPTLPSGLLREALTALERADLVLSPDPDGGYNLVGLHRPVSGLFRHEMSTDSVFERTRQHAERRGMHTTALSGSFDIDHASDFSLLEAALRADAGPDCERTRAFMDECGLWNASRR